MRKHAIYYFSGTGNSLKAALTIQKALGDCSVVSMGTSPKPLGNVSSIGFVFPCHFGGVPKGVLDFIAGMDFSEHGSAYIYAVTTYGAIVSSTLGQLNKALRRRGATLSYSAALKAFSNYVVLYDMSDKVSEKATQTKADLQPILTDILEQKTVKTKRALPFLTIYNRIASRGIRTRDSNFVVGASCDSCGVCKKVCAVHNIEINSGVPHWLGHCEQCLACLHWCPKQAINYGEKTEKRGRYTNPEITTRVFIDSLDSTSDDS